MTVMLYFTARTTSKNIDKIRNVILLSFDFIKGLTIQPWNLNQPKNISSWLQTYGMQ
jgi:hypothetical protein